MYIYIYIYTPLLCIPVSTTSLQYNTTIYGRLDTFDDNLYMIHI